MLYLCISCFSNWAAITVVAPAADATRQELLAMWAAMSCCRWVMSAGPKLALFSAIAVCSCSSRLKSLARNKSMKPVCRSASGMGYCSDTSRASDSTSAQRAAASSMICLSSLRLIAAIFARWQLMRKRIISTKDSGVTRKRWGHFPVWEARRGWKPGMSLTINEIISWAGCKMNQSGCGCGFLI